MTQPSALYQLIETKLDGPLADFVAARWPAKSWRKIAAELTATTEVPVKAETVRLWFAGRTEVRTIIRDAPARTGSAA